MKTCYTKRASLGGQLMNLIRKTILILILLIPFTIYATSEMTASDGEEVGVIQNVQVLTNEDNDEVSQTLRDYSIRDFKLYASELVIEKWSSHEVYAFGRIVHKESSWIHNKEHYADGKSSATGFGGFLTATWATVGCEKTYDQYVQLECMVKYVSSRYGTPSKALEFHNRKGWY